jgi:hypothetical protein
MNGRLYRGTNMQRYCGRTPQIDTPDEKEHSQQPLRGGYDIDLQVEMFVMM